MPDSKQIGVGVAFLVLILCVVIVITKPWTISSIGNYQNLKHSSVASTPKKLNNTQARGVQVQQVKPTKKLVQHRTTPLQTSLYTLSASATGPVSGLGAPIYNPNLELPVSVAPPRVSSPPVPLFTPSIPTTPVVTIPTMSPPIPSFEMPISAAPKMEAPIDVMPENIAVKPATPPSDTKEETHRAELLRGSSVGRTKMATPTTSAMMMASINRWHPLESPMSPCNTSRWGQSQIGCDLLVLLSYWQCF